jgi:hypothetical protein
MPAFLEKKLKAEYPGNNRAVYGTMNKLGAMKGSKETPKGARMQAQHDADVGKKKKKAAPFAKKLGAQLMEA